MTEKLPALRSVSLRLHCGARSTTWAVIYRTTRGDALFDRRVSSGSLPGTSPLVGPATVVRALEAAVDDLRERYGLPPRDSAPVAPGGVGGRLGSSHPDLLPTVPLSVVRDRPLTDS